MSALLLNRRVVTVYSIYSGLPEHPGKFVVQRFLMGAYLSSVDGKPFVVTDDLTSARKALPGTLYRMKPNPADDPLLIESWA